MDENLHQLMLNGKLNGPISIRKIIDILSSVIDQSKILIKNGYTN